MLESETHIYIHIHMFARVYMSIRVCIHIYVHLHCRRPGDATLNVPLWHKDYFEKQQTWEELWKQSRSYPLGGNHEGNLHLSGCLPCVPGGGGPVLVETPTPFCVTNVSRMGVHFRVTSLNWPPLTRLPVVAAGGPAAWVLTSFVSCSFLSFSHVHTRETWIPFCLFVLWICL